MNQDTDRIIESIVSLLPSTAFIDVFAKVYLSSLSARTLSSESHRYWAQFIGDRFDFISQHLDLEKPAFHFGSHSPDGQICYLEYIYPDAPFLLLTIESILRELGITITKMYHPIFAIETKKHELSRLAKASMTSSRYSIAYIECDKIDDPDLIDTLQKRIDYHLSAVLSIDRDLPKVVSTLNTLKKAIPKSDVPLDEPSSEWVNLSDWLKNENFSFMGYCQFQFKKASTPSPKSKKYPPDSMVHTLIKGSELGILSKKNDVRFDKIISELTSHSWKQRTYPSYHRFDQISAISPIQRFEKLMRLSFRFESKNGDIIEHAFVGILRQSSLHAKNLDTPIIHLKMHSIFKARNMLPGSYDYNEVIRIFTSIPKYDLFRRSAHSLLLMVDDLLSITNPNEIYCFTRPKSDTRLPLLVVIPPRHFTHDNVNKISDYLMSHIPHSQFEAIEIPSDEHARVQYYFEQKDRDSYEPDCPALEIAIRELITTWDERFRASMEQAYSGELGRHLFHYYDECFPDHYRFRRQPSDAVDDVRMLERLAKEGRTQFNLVPFHFSQSVISGKASLLIIYHKEKIELINIMPILENMGFHVFDELTTRIGKPQSIHGYMHNFRLADRSQKKIDEARFRHILLELLNHVFSKRTANDSLNQLCLLSELDWRAINVMQSYRDYLFQISDFTRKKISRTLLTHPTLTRLLFEYFDAKFNPDSTFGDRQHRERVRLPDINAKFTEALHHVSDITEDLIFRRLLNLLHASVRTNVYTSSTHSDSAISIKFDSSRIDQLPHPIPFREVYVHDVGLEGCHLRFGPVSRGGLRWSDRPDDFRKEVLDLVKTQQSKNVVIVPVGSKGGFVVKHSSSNHKEMMEDAVRQYKRFISSLLDITDNVGETVGLCHPDHALRYDGNDPYLVVAADKGTAMFSDFANDVSKKYGFWLGDAFASGGSAGYNHKEVGITAKGAWECVKLHFREMGKDIQSEDFTAVGIGDMSGDVFGNGMLLSPHTRLLAAFNHIHIFIDPNPDAAKSWKERHRLFHLAGSSWTDYHSSLISKGGGVFNRKSKKIILTPEIKALLGVKASHLTGDGLISALLKMPTDLLWFGGIGTYVKSSRETHLSVADPANDSVRVDCRHVRASVIGEGANLGITQHARIEMSLAGIRLNSDAIDNSAGVNMSDYEVNIKILLNLLLHSGHIRSMADRNKELSALTDDVTTLCLRNNRRQHRLLSLDMIRSTMRGHTFIRLVRHLESLGRLHPLHDGIPDYLELDELTQAKQPFPRPVLAVIQAFVKMWVYDELIDSSLPDADYLEPFYTTYFPTRIQTSFSAQLHQHHLKKEILCTSLCNKIINQTGIGFYYHLNELTGRSFADITNAYLIADTAISGDELRKMIFKSSRVQEEIKYNALIALEDILEHMTRDLLEYRSLTLDAKLADQFHQILSSRHSVSSSYRSAYALSVSMWKEKGFSSNVAKRLSLISYMYGSVDVLFLHIENILPPTSAITLMDSLDDVLDLVWLRKKLSAIPVETHWDILKKDMLFQQIRSQKVALVRYLHSKKGTTSNRSSWDKKHVTTILKEDHETMLTVFTDTLKHLRSKGHTINLTSVSVAISRLAI